MKAFADLYSELDETTRTTEKVEAMVRYFRPAARNDAAWAVYFLDGRKPRQVVPPAELRRWATEELAGIPDWLFQESYDAVGDLAETIALLLPLPGRREPTYRFAMGRESPAAAAQAGGNAPAGRGPRRLVASTHGSGSSGTSSSAGRSAWASRSSS